MWCACIRYKGDCASYRYFVLHAFGDKLYGGCLLGEKEALHNPLKLALLLCFFPQIMEGPISIYSKTENTLWEGKPVKASNLSDGCVRIFWGLFKKMIIADRLYVPVQVIFESYTDYSGVSVAVAAIAYTVQLYMEFSGCMDIVIGSAKLFGITLPENFKQPFASKNAAEFLEKVAYYPRSLV